MYSGEPISRRGGRFVVNFIGLEEDFTFGVQEGVYGMPTVAGWVDGMSACGGGDVPEAVADGLYYALHLTYREQATKICVWIGKLTFFRF